MASIGDLFGTSKQALADGRYFDGVQTINSALELYEEQLTAGKTDITVEKLDILRTPEIFFMKVKGFMTKEQCEEVATMFGVRAQLLEGLGAVKRALVDVSASLLLVPDNSEMAKKQVEP